MNQMNKMHNYVKNARSQLLKEINTHISYPIKFDT